MKIFKRTLVIIFIIIIISLLMISCTKNVKKLSNEEATIIEIIDTKYNKNENFIKANEWLVKTFVSSKDVIQFSDKEAGIVVGKIIMYFNEIPSIEREAKFIIKLETKDNRIKITLTDMAMKITYDLESGPFVDERNFNQAEWDKYQPQFIDIIDGLIDFMSTDVKTDDNW